MSGPMKKGLDRDTDARIGQQCEQHRKQRLEEQKSLEEKRRNQINPNNSSPKK